MNKIEEKPNCQRVYDRLLQLISNKGYRNREYRPEIEFSFMRPNTTRPDETYGDWVSGKLFGDVCKDVDILGDMHYIRKIIFRTPFNAEIYTLAYNSAYTLEEDYLNQAPQNYTRYYRNDLVRFKWVDEIANCNQSTKEHNNEKNKLMDVRGRIEGELKIRIERVNRRSNELDEVNAKQAVKLQEFDGLIDRYTHLECELNKSLDEVKQIKSKNLELQTELTAVRVENYCLETPEDLEKVEDMLVVKKRMRGTIEQLKKELGNKKVENKILKNKLYFVRGQKDMIREVLRGGTLVVHREVNNVMRSCDHNH